jgi:acyl dehydratase
MPFNREFLTSYAFRDSRQSYGARETILYALGLGLGSRPTDPAHLQFTYEKGLKALPTLAVVLAHPGFWAKEPELGIDWPRMLHGEQGLSIFKPVPAEGEVIGRSRITDVVDRGKEKGALIHYERDVVDATSGDLIATSRQTLVCRGNGGFGGGADKARAPRELAQPPARAPDHVAETRTMSQMALIYRLSGDMNPLHADPEIARKAGFTAPILHGLATYALGALAVLEYVCGFDPARLRSFDVRFTAPVLPGETIRTELWIDGVEVALRARAIESGKVVMDNGRAIIAA